MFNREKAFRVNDALLTSCRGGRSSWPGVQLPTCVSPLMERGELPTHGDLAESRVYQSALSLTSNAVNRPHVRLQALNEKKLQNNN